MQPPEDPSRAAAPPPATAGSYEVPAPRAAVDPAAARQTYDGFLREHHTVLAGFARRYCGDDALGEDLLQDAVLDIWSAIIVGTVEAATLTPAYVKNGVRWKFRDHLRGQRRRENRHDMVGQWQSRRWDGDDPGERTFDNDDFHRARALLPERHWEIFVLTEAYGFSPAEIAERLELNPRTVSNYLSIARKKITEMIRSVPH